MPRAPQAHTAGGLAEQLGLSLRGDRERPVSGAAPLDKAGPEDLSFLANPRYRQQLLETAAGVVIVAPQVAEASPATALVAENPYAAWARALECLFPEPRPEPGIHHSVVLGTDAEVAEDARLEANVVVGAGTRIEAGAWIEAGSVVGADCVVGAESRVGPNVTLYSGTELGKRVRLHSGVVLGADGFGLAPEDGAYRKIPQVGRVVIEDDVEIGANSSVDRAALEETRVGRGTKIDNLVQIGHNCRIGAHCILSGQAGISGSTEIGEHCTLAGQTGVAGHLHIPPGTTLTAKAGVISEIREPGVYSGFPHQPHGEWRRSLAGLRQLRGLRERLQALERAVKGNPEGGDT
ncbi:UDP-3-O-(3-hydroxymyristoyl)glucosamine N-acyltransferase [Thiohalorhabdus methylotrophus]|uniref:UDP-3-O-acylglucosamine N-acyltransferase n=1 Tax=Thiohalorhabdus methylotrophus TaxID=3242694 RepID=A0ABV4TWP7_9GAMM